MKTIKILLLLFTFAITSCSSDEQTQPITQQPISICGAVISIQAINVTHLGGVVVKYKYRVRLNDNRNAFVLLDLNNYYSIGENVCRTDFVIE